MRFDMFVSMMYPADYGFIPETLALDGSTRRFGFSNRAYVFWLCDGSKANWCFHMADDKGQMKVICVPVSDPIWNSLENLSDINPHLKEIEHFFQVYTSNKLM
jgi:inorganic pyrophosphatase